MKKLFKSKIALVIIAAGLLISCKTNNSNAGEESLNGVDSTETSVDTVGPSTDTINGANGAGTTGATGEGSTGSGSAGTTQKGNTSVRTDSTSTGTGGGN